MKAIGSLFGAGEPTVIAPPPPLAPPPVMPTPDDRAVRDARRRSLAQQYMRRGRDSTVLSQDYTGGNQTLG